MFTLEMRDGRDAGFSHTNDFIKFGLYANLNLKMCL